MSCALTHYSYDRIAKETDRVVDEHKLFGCRYIGIGCIQNGLRNGRKDYAAFHGAFKPAGKRMAELGCRLMYHNHDMEFARCGEGNMDFDSILEACEAAGTQYLLVEQDDCYGEDPFECLKTSYINLKSKGL